jgi:hypothetical protein
MLTAEQLQRFSRECLLLRRAIEEGHSVPELDYRILRSNLQILLATLEKGRKHPSNPSDIPAVQRLDP